MGLFKLQEAATALGVSKKVVMGLIDNKVLDAVNSGTTIYITPGSIYKLTGGGQGKSGGYPVSEELKSPLTNKDVVENSQGDDSMAYKGSVSKLNDGRYMVQIDLGKDDAGKRKRYNKSFKAEPEAQEHLRRKLNELNGVASASAVAVEKGGTNYTALTFEEYAMNYIRSGGSGKASSMTLENYRRSLKYVMKYIGKKPMTAITKEDLKAAFTGVSKEYADGVLSKTCTVTKMILKSAYEDGDIPSDPTRNLSKPKSRLPKKNKDDDLAAFSNEDLQVFFEKSIDYNFELYTIFTVFACTGMRPEELRALEWSSFDAKKKTIDIHQAVVNVFDKPESFYKQPKKHEEISITKSEYGVRVLPLSNLAVQALLDWKKKLKSDKNANRAHSTFIFPNTNGDYKKGSSLESLIKRFRNKYHLEYTGVHSYKFRHTMCTNLVLAGQPIPVIQRIIGDDTTDMILRVYAHVSNENAIKAAAGFYADMNETNRQIASNRLSA